MRIRSCSALAVLFTKVSEIISMPEREEFYLREKMFGTPEWLKVRRKKKASLSMQRVQEHLHAGLSTCFRPRSEGCGDVPSGR